MGPAQLIALAVLALASLSAGAQEAASSGDGGDGGEEMCKPCAFTQGSAAFGILYGGPQSGPLALRPLDLLRQDTSTALPLANPVLTALELTERLGSSSPGGGNTAGRMAAVDAIAHPAPVAAADGRLLTFFAAHACGRDRWGIAAAEAVDGSGGVWRGLGMVLEQDGADLHAPALFQHNGTWYLVPEIGGQQEVRVFRATRFPLGWELAGVLVQQPLAGVSVVRHEERWWLLGHRAGAGLGGQDHVLAVFQATSPLGPWSPHLGGTFATEAATTSGAAFVWQGAIHQLARACRGGACGQPHVVRLHVSDAAVEHRRAQLDLGRPLWRQQAGWSSAGWTHLGVTQRQGGSWLAVLEASQLPPAVAVLPRQLQAAIAAFRALALLCIAVLLLNAAVLLPVGGPLLRKQRWAAPLLASSHGASSLKLAKQALPSFQPLADAGAVAHLNGFSTATGSGKGAATPTARQRSGGTLRRGNGHGHAEGRPAPQNARLLRHWLPYCQLVLAGLGLAAALLGAGTARRVHRLAQPFFVQPRALPVDGQWSRFTLMVMSYDRRLHELQRYVRHYSRCPSVGEVLVVWNRGAPPDPAAAFRSDVPVRVRVEAVNSMNNRFRPDPAMKFRAVLSLDDDIMMPCTTIEAAFARWRQAPQQLAGFYPRLLLPRGGQGSEGPPVYQFEEAVFQQGAYNAILAGAAFMDSSTFFPLYWAAATAPARALVDALFNCDDLLMNFVAANWTRGGGGAGGASAQPSVQLLRPERRLDVSRLSGVGISHDRARFKEAADRCLAEFSQLFGGCPLQLRTVEPHYGRPPRCGLLWGRLDCMYLG